MKYKSEIDALREIVDTLESDKEKDIIRGQTVERYQLRARCTSNAIDCTRSLIRMLNAISGIYKIEEK